MQATVRCLADNGRLLEIGKYDILKGTPLSMRPMLRNCAFEGIDLDRIVNDPSNITEVFALADTINRRPVITPFFGIALAAHTFVL